MSNESFVCCERVLIETDVVYDIRLINLHKEVMNNDTVLNDSKNIQLIEFYTTKNQIHCSFIQSPLAILSGD